MDLERAPGADEPRKGLRAAILKKVLAAAAVPAAWVWLVWGGPLDAALLAAFLLMASVWVGAAALAATAATFVVSSSGPLTLLPVGLDPVLPALAAIGAASSALASVRRLTDGFAGQRHGLAALCGWVALAALAMTLFRSVSRTHALLWALLYGLAWWELRRISADSPREKTSPATYILTAASILFSLLVLELGARLIFPGEAVVDPLYMHHPEYRYLLAPNGHLRVPVPVSETERKYVTHVTSSQGLRDHYVPTKQAGEYRIAMIGDSFAEGFGTELEDTIPKQLEARLQKDMPGRRIRVINGAMGGGGAWQELGMLRERVLPLEPDLVILQIFPFNDISDALDARGRFLRAYSDQKLYELGLFWSMGRKRYWPERMLFRYSRAYHVLRESTMKLWVLDLLNDCRLVPPVELDRPPPSADRLYWMEVNLEGWYPELEEAYRLWQRDVLLIRQECRDRGLDLIAYAIPDRSDLSDGDWEHAVSQAQPPVRYERGKGLRMVEEFLQREAIPTVDVPKALREAGRTEDLYIPFDGHLNEKGHKVTADALAEYLEKEYFQAEETRWTENGSCREAKGRYAEGPKM